MNSRKLICHPGEESASRHVSALGTVTTHSVTLPAGSILLSAVSTVMNSIGGDSGVVVLDGAHLGPFNYVMPDQSQDGLHAAWYSDTHTCDRAQLRNATAIIGKRDGQCWLHCHALWDAEGHSSDLASSHNSNQKSGHKNGHKNGMGHLLPDQVTITDNVEATLYEFNGGSFNVELDTETAFPIFHVQGSLKSGNAFIAKVNPHEDIATTIEQLITEAGFSSARVFGIGSLIGTQFENDSPMLCPISEVLIGSDAKWKNQTLTLPMHCVDIDGNLFSGNVRNGDAPVLVTFELLVIEI